MLDRTLLAKHQEHTHFLRATSVREGKVAEFERSLRKLGASSLVLKCVKCYLALKIFFLTTFCKILVSVFPVESTIVAVVL